MSLLLRSGICLAVVWWLAALPPVSALAAEDAARDAEAVVRETTRTLLRTLVAEQAQMRADPALTRRRLLDIVGPRVDFDTIGRLLLGRHWRAASVEQRRDFVREFRDLLLRSYATAMVEFVVRRGLSHDDFDYLSSTATPDGRRVLVRTRLRGGQARPLSIHYSMRRTEAGWQVYDVSVDAISLVATYRSTFDQEIQQNGLDGLIRRLAGKLSEGADSAADARPSAAAAEQ